MSAGVPQQCGGKVAGGELRVNCWGPTVLTVPEQANYTRPLQRVKQLAAEKFLNCIHQRCPWKAGLEFLSHLYSLIRNGAER